MPWGVRGSAPFATRYLGVYFTNTDSGNAMNVSGEFGGTPQIIHNGINSVRWFGSNIVGSSVNFATSERAYQLNLANKMDGPALGDIWEYDNTAPFSLSGYVALTGWVSIDTSWSPGDSVAIYGWDGTSSEVGNRVLLEDYLDTALFDVWQQFVVPLADLGLEGGSVEALRMEQVGVDGASPVWFLDSLHWEQTGTPQDFVLASPTDTDTLYISALTVTLADTATGTVADGTMPGLSYDQLLGEAQLETGIVLTQRIAGVEHFLGRFRDLADFFSFGFRLVGSVSDGVDTMVTLRKEFSEALAIRGADADNNLTMTVADDLTGLLLLRAHADCRVTTSRGN